jgi:hypothetical protein
MLFSDHDSLAMSRKAKRLDIVARRGTLPHATLMVHAVPPASSLVSPSFVLTFLPLDNRGSFSKNKKSPWVGETALSFSYSQHISLRRRKDNVLSSTKRNLYHIRLKSTIAKYCLVVKLWAIKNRGVLLCLRYFSYGLILPPLFPSFSHFPPISCLRSGFVYCAT